MPADCARVPSADQLDSVLKALQVFNSSLHYTWNHTRKQEEDILPRFEDIADALAAVQPAVDAADGTGPDWWANEAVPVLRDIGTWLQAVAADWGWVPYLTPSLRQATKEERRERFREEYEQPIDEAAMVWFREDRTHCPGDVWERARRGRQAGYSPEMTLDEARRRCASGSLWYRREAEAPCYGGAYPRLEEEREKRLWRLFHELRAALGLMPRETGQARPDAPQGEQGITPVPIPDDPAQWPSLLAWLNAEIRRSTTIENDPRLKIELAQSPNGTRVYDLNALHRAKNEIVARMAATKSSQAPEAPAAPAAHQPATGSPPPHKAPAADAATKRKRSTERGEGRVKLIAVLSKHHKYADGGCLNLEPIGNNELARAADVSPSTASAFFHDKFQGYMKYKALCRDKGTLVAALKLLNGEYSPHDLYGRRPADEDDRDDE